MRVAVVGHHEWVTFARVDALPSSGDIVHVNEWWEEPAGGGSAAAVQLAKLSDETIFFTAFGDDYVGRRAAQELAHKGLRVEATHHGVPTRRAFTHIDIERERTITVMGRRLDPRAEDDLAWDLLKDTDAVYLTAGDEGAVQLARLARILVATARVLPLLQRAGVELDALVGSAVDPSESYEDGDLDPPPRLVVRTEGGGGGTFAERGKPNERFAAAALSGPIVDRYGAGDAFAAGLTWALGAGRTPFDAVAIAARCGAGVVTGRGPYEGQPTLASLGASRS